MTTNDQDIYRSLGRLESKMDSVLDLLKTADLRITAHGTRISAIESWRASVRGSVTTIAAVASVIVSLLTGFLLKRL